MFDQNLTNGMFDQNFPFEIFVQKSLLKNMILICKLTGRNFYPSKFPTLFRDLSFEADVQLVEWCSMEHDKWSRVNQTSFQTRVFGWGHNNKSQLGGVSDLGTKVKTPSESITLNALNPTTIILGEQCIFVISG